MIRSVIAYWLAFLVVASAAYGALWAWRAGKPDVDAIVAKHGSDLGVDPDYNAPDREPIEEFTLTDSEGEDFHSSELDGKVWIGSFFFTACPGSCLKMNQVLAGLHEQLAETDVRFVSISCDPYTDTPEQLAAYAEHFKADPQRWTFLTGPMKTVKDIGLDIFAGVGVEARTHSDRLILLDRKGEVRGRYRATEQVDMAMMLRVLKEILAEPAGDADEASTAAIEADAVDEAVEESPREEN